MKIIISPAKKMSDKQDVFESEGKPMFLKEANKLRQYLKNLGWQELKEILQCSDDLVDLNYKRYQEDNPQRITALTSYVGLQYQHMAPHLFSIEEWNYCKEYLWILSGMYGVVRPQDEIAFYRLEMQAIVKGFKEENLYQFWESAITKLVEQEDVIINLASKEYSDVLQDKQKVVDIVFAQEVKGQLQVKGTQAKMARGAMVRYMAENNVTKVESLKKFNAMGFVYRDELSSSKRLVFIWHKEICN